MVGSDFVDENFFVISSENINNCKSRLYGYSVFKKIEEKQYNIYINGIVENIPLNADGSYINVTKNGDNIEIQQDCNGTYGLYLYQKDGFFAISNSYFYLLNYLKGKVSLSLNVDFAKYYIMEGLASMSVSETLTNEIQLLSKDVIVKIDILKKNISVVNSIQKIQETPLDSEEGIAILDTWYDKWQSILISLQESNQKVSVDLTGGMDSRAVFSIFNNSVINFDSIWVNSSTSGLHTHKEDYEVASKISDRMNFKLNQRFELKSRFISSETAINHSFLAKLGTHKQFYFKNHFLEDRMFCFTGSGGESIRRHWYMPPENFIKNQIKEKKFKTLDHQDSTAKIVANSIEEIKRRNPGADQVLIMRQLYQNTRLRSHFGKSNVENFLGNRLFLNPLMDLELQKIHSNDDTLLCLIYERYFQEVNDVAFEGGRTLDLDCVERAKKINDKYPYKTKLIFSNLQPYLKRNGSYTAEIIDRTKSKPEKVVNSTNPRMEMMSRFQSEEVKKMITSVVGDEVYQKTLEYWKKAEFFPDAPANSLISVAIAVNASKTSGLFKSDQNVKLYSNNDIFTRLLNIFDRARIDIKNQGVNGNDIEFDLGSKYDITSPKWFNNEGVGYIIQDNSLLFNIKFKCIKDGSLEIRLRGINIQDNENRRIPAWIDYVSCKLNGVEQLDSVVETWHDKPFSISKSIKDGEEIDLSIEWQAHNYDIDEFINTTQELFVSLLK